MLKMTIGLALVMTSVPDDQLPGSTSIVCTEERGGWCESSGICYNNTLTPAKHIIQMVRLPNELEESQVSFKECRNDKCGKSYIGTIKKGVSDYFIKSDPALLIFNEDTKFYTYISYIHAVDISRTIHAFGHCEVSRGIDDR